MAGSPRAPRTSRARWKQADLHGVAEVPTRKEMHAKDYELVREFEMVGCNYFAANVRFILWINTEFT